MRTIKFRAWTGKKMMCQDKQYLASFIRRVVPQIILDRGGEDYREHESYLPNGGAISEYLMQFTGLTDKNGKDIYEHDVIRMFGFRELDIVLWCDNGFYTVPLNSEDVSPSLIPHDHRGKSDSVEIIGNIYENPEYRIMVGKDLS